VPLASTKTARVELVDLLRQRLIKGFPKTTLSIAGNR
jgi:hypothetical protein